MNPAKIIRTQAPASGRAVARAGAGGMYRTRDLTPVTSRVKTATYRSEAISHGLTVVM